MVVDWVRKGGFGDIVDRAARQAELDRSLLAILCQDSRLSPEQMKQEFFPGPDRYPSVNTIRNRIAAMVESGVFTYTISLRGKPETERRLFLLIKASNTQSRASLRHYLLENEYVQDFHRTRGVYDFVVLASSERTADLNALADSLEHTGLVRDIEQVEITQTEQLTMRRLALGLDRSTT